MKKKLLITILVVVIIGGFWGLFDNKDDKYNDKYEKPNYDYSADQYVMDHLEKYIPQIEDHLEKSKQKCINEENILSCLMVIKFEAWQSKDINKVAFFYEEILPEYCFERNFAPACNIVADDLIRDKITYEEDKKYSKKEKKERSKIIEWLFELDDEFTEFEHKKYRKTSENIKASKVANKMFEYGCKNPKNEKICNEMRYIYQGVSAWQILYKQDISWGDPNKIKSSI